MKKSINNRNRKTVMLTLTENCNLSCVYCFERAKTKKVMDIQVAKEIINYEIKNSDEFDEIEFCLFGGEPTLNIQLIKDIVEWSLKQNFKKPYLFFLETNGTLVHGVFQDWLHKNKEYVYVGLSLDGTPDTHDFNRSNSYNLIDIDFFVNNYSEQPVRMTINYDTIRNLSQDVVHLHKIGFPEVVSTFALGINWDIDKIREILVLELRKLCDFYIENPNIKECSLFDMNLPGILKEDKILKKWCGTGTNMVSYGIDGTKYPCHTFQPNTLESKEIINFSEINFNLIKDFSDPECSNCFIEAICPNCYGMNYVKNKNIFSRDKNLCEIIKIRVLATSYLKAQQIERNIIQFEPNVMFQTIKAIKAIQNNFLSN